MAFTTEWQKPLIHSNQGYISLPVAPSITLNDLLNQAGKRVQLDVRLHFVM